MRIVQRDHEVEVRFRTHAGRRLLPTVEVDLPDVQWDDPEIPRLTHGWWTLAALALAGILVGGAIVGLDGRAGWERTALVAVTVVAPLAVPLLWALGRIRLRAHRPPLHREHALVVGPAGTWLDGQRCEIWLAGDRLITTAGDLFALAEEPWELQQLEGLLAPGADVARERAGDERDVPDALRQRIGSRQPISSGKR